MSRLSGKPGRDCPLCPRLAAFRDDWREPRAGLVQRAGRLIRTARCAAPDRRPRARPARRQPHRPAVHRRLCRRPALRHAHPTTASHAAVTKRGPTTGSNSSMPAITNAVRCVPPENKPTPAEIKTCRGFLTDTIAEMPKLAVIVTLGRIAHDSTLAALSQRRAACPFGHGAAFEIGRIRADRQLSLLALQHEYRRADARNVPRGVRQRARLSRRPALTRLRQRRLQDSCR